MLYKILIADDERIECRALCHKLEEKFPELLILPCAYNGIELIQYVEQYRPDIIVVDINMPGLNGLEAVELLKMKENRAKIIIHTAYSQFTYAKKAIELGAEAYVLKPDADDEMMNVLTKLCAGLKRESQKEQKRQEEQQEVDCLRDIVAKKWLLSLYQGEPDEECYQMLLKNYSILEKGGFLTAWKLETAEGKNLSEDKRAQKRLSAYMKELCSCVEFIHKGKLIFLIMPGEKQDDHEWFQEIAACIIQEMEKQGIHAAAGVSGYKKTEEAFAEGIYEAMMALQDADAGKAAFFRSGKEQRKLLDFRSMQRSARELSKGNIENCMIFAKEMFRMIEEDKKAAAFVYLMEMKESVDFSEDKAVEWEWRLWRNFGELRTEKEIEQWLQEGLTICYDGICGKDEENSAYIRKTYLFIDENYSRDISLENAAEAVGISYFYLSRMLKQEKNANFSEVLTNVRIWRAIKKMRDSRKPIREISAEVGYANVTYFYKVFKKTAGISVGTMRKFL